MNKFYGKIGFSQTVESPANSGIWVNEIVEKNYYGDIVRFSRRIETGTGVNDDINLTNQLSIIADPFISNNIGSICYVKWLGSLWKITSVEVQYPRLLLTIGGLYNGVEASASSSVS